jgi:hypothetical protein
MLPEDDPIIETCRSVLSVSMWNFRSLNEYMCICWCIDSIKYQWHWRFRSFGIRRYSRRQSVPGFSKKRSGLIFSGRNVLRLDHTPEDRQPQLHRCEKRKTRTPAIQGFLLPAVCYHLQVPARSAPVTELYWISIHSSHLTTISK